MSSKEKEVLKERIKRAIEISSQKLIEKKIIPHYLIIKTKNSAALIFNDAEIILKEFFKKIIEVIQLISFPW